MVPGQGRWVPRLVVSLESRRAGAAFLEGSVPQDLEQIGLKAAEGPGEPTWASSAPACLLGTVPGCLLGSAVGQHLPCEYPATWLASLTAPPQSWERAGFSAFRMV